MEKWEFTSGSKPGIAQVQHSSFHNFLKAALYESSEVFQMWRKSRERYMVVCRYREFWIQTGTCDFTASGRKVPKNT